VTQARLWPFLSQDTKKPRTLLSAEREYGASLLETGHQSGLLDG
jgi:hypothetical protein